MAQDDVQEDVNTIPPVTIEDFSPVSPLVNSETDAVMLQDSGASTLDANLNNGFFIKYYEFRRMLILKKTALEEVSKNTIFYAKDMNGKKLKSLHVFTYNLENGKIVKTELRENDIFFEETKSNLKSLKFTFPNMKVGSIIEFEYSERLNSTDLENWYFQSDYPKLKSVYTVILPDLFNFSIQFQNKKYLTNTNKKTVVKTVFSSVFEYLNSTITTISWTFENVPAMREEPYTSTVKNFLACVKFQISARPQKPGVTLAVLRDWQEVCNNIMNSSEFGVPISDPSSFIKKQAIVFTEGKSTDLQKAKAIYSGVRDHFKVSSRGIFSTNDQTLNDIYKAGTGIVGEINSILIAMLRSQKIQADPVILATRDIGLTNQTYPLLENYNYLVCRIVVDEKIYYLDASDPTMGFGKIPLDCYNGHARVVSKKNFPVFLAPDSLKETRFIKADIRNENNSKSMILESTNLAGYYESSDFRLELKEKTLESVFNTRTQTVPFKKTLDSFSVTNLKDLDEPVILYYKMTLDPGNNSHIYFNPFLNYGLTENPFKSAQRSYPVELSFVLDKTYEMNMEIPAGYEIEEIPKSEKVFLNESDGSYEYKVEVSGNKIRVKSVLILTKAIFEPEDYVRLKDFYATMIKKQNEMIVFKKKN